MVSNNKMLAEISSQELHLMCKTHKVNSWLGDSDEENNDATKRRSNDKILSKNKPPPYKLSKSANQIKQEQLVAAVAENNNANVHSAANICRGYGEVVKDGSDCKAGAGAEAGAKTKQASHSLQYSETKKVLTGREHATTQSAVLQESMPRQASSFKIQAPHHSLDVQGKQNNTRNNLKKGLDATVSLKQKKSKPKFCRTTSEINQNDNTHLYSNLAAQVPLTSHLLLQNNVQESTNSCTSEYVWPREYIKNIKRFNTIQTQSEQVMQKLDFIKKTTKKPKMKGKGQPNNKQDLYVDANSFSLLAPCTDDENSESNDESVKLECDLNGEINESQETTAQEKGTKKKKHRKKGSKDKTIEKNSKHIKLVETKDRFVLRDKNCNELTEIYHAKQFPLPEYFFRRYLRIVHSQRGSERYMPQCIEVQEQMVHYDVMHRMCEKMRHSRITSPQTLFGRRDH